jgi:hypothetical protein
MLKEEEQKKTSVAASIRRSALAFQEADEYAGPAAAISNAAQDFSPRWL